jgi:uncharacterized protein YbaR (Trm112 family)
LTLSFVLAEETLMPIRTELLEILACPKCKGPVRLAENDQSLRCDTCRLAYPIRDEIPVMLIDEAQSF